MKVQRKRYASMEDVLLAVETYLLDINQQGGRIELPLALDYRPPEEQSNTPFRLSSSGKCARKLAYQLHIPEEKEELTPRSISVFQLGHILHDVERHLIGTVTDLHSQESSVFFDVEDVGLIEGHCDGIIELADRQVFVDIKTSSQSGFDEMVKNGPSYDYLCQLNAYMDAAGIHEAYLWLYCKNTSRRHVVPVPYDPRILQEVRARFKRVFDSTPDQLPEREHKAVAEVRKKVPTGREYLPWQCTYCAFTGPCWSHEGFQMVIENNKPRWIRDAQSVLNLQAAEELDALFSQAEPEGVADA